jgi:hypothetical protein
MLDDLRDSATESYMEEEEGGFYEDEAVEGDGGNGGKKKPLMGLNPAQRFIIAFIVFLMTCVLGAFCLILTGKMWLPFF